MGWFDGSDDVQKAREELDRVVTREVQRNGGKPISEDNPAYQAANAKVNNAIRQSGKATRWLNGG
ncbi:hypothetical protein [Microbispora triticiradicis]|uniref:hypothetical protein n=1 Tax=Microbispora triticiradicis TaxID=2200763 RepID=UPI001AD67FCC|nr:hypothetical protein [Microbispora triticiradicis]MBO4275163.1 hypothetical protein [Microbispora triticiradicis]